MKRDLPLIAGLIPVYLVPALFLKTDWDWWWVAGLALCCILISAHDFQRFEIPDWLTVVVTLLPIWVLWQDELLLAHGIVAVGVTGFFWIAGQIAYCLKEREYLGIGDAKLLGAFALWHGISYLPDIVFFASIGAILCHVIGRQDRLEGLPFGPFICFAGYGFLFLDPLLTQV